MSWDSRSGLFYWRWHSELQQFAVKGIPPYITLRLPQSKRPTRKPNKQIYPKLLEKIINFILRDYFVFPNPGSVKILIDYFTVPKGSDDVRMVFNGSSCGLNDSLWSPNFWLPTAKTILRASSFNSRYVDMDLGEMFHNFLIHEDIKAH